MKSPTLRIGILGIIIGVITQSWEECFLKGEGCWNQCVGVVEGFECNLKVEGCWDQCVNVVEGVEYHLLPEWLVY